MGSMTPPELRKNEAEGRYEAWLGDELAGYTTYARQGDVVVFPHTVTVPRFGGRGIAAAVAGFGLDDVAREPAVRVDPQCWYVAEFIERNPDPYARLLRD